MAEDAPTCQIHQKYRRVKCPYPALPGDPEGFCILHCQDPAKDPAAFREAILAIRNRDDSEAHDFSGVFFPGPIEPKDLFGSLEFSKPVDFSWATFTQEAYFTGATFTEGTNFSEATFTQKANFSGAIFNEGADFFLATFTKEAFFS
jgi:uncharacterized protein YjbI with pentapeptide repeats